MSSTQTITPKRSNTPEATTDNQEDGSAILNQVETSTKSPNTHSVPSLVPPDARKAIPTREVDTDLVSVIPIDVATFKPLRKIRGHANTQRRSEALELGVTAFGKMFLSSETEPASRRVCNKVFPKEFRLLDDLLNIVQCAELDEGSEAIYYSLQGHLYNSLLNLLYSQRLKAVDTFRLAAVKPPALPCWGEHGEVNSFVSENDFEIHGVCFRAEVDYFLSFLDGYHDYSLNKPRDFVLKPLDNEEGPFDGSKPSTPSQEFVDEDPVVRNDEGDSKQFPSFNKNVNSLSKRQSGSYNHGKGSSKPRNISTMFPLPANRRMSELMQPVQQSSQKVVSGHFGQFNDFNTPRQGSRRPNIGGKYTRDHWNNYPSVSGHGMAHF
jgi:hypothetical protein